MGAGTQGIIIAIMYNNKIIIDKIHNQKEVNQSLRTRAGSPYKLCHRYFSADISKNRQSRRISSRAGDGRGWSS